MITPDHDAVKHALLALQGRHLNENVVAHTLNVALNHISADGLRHTTAGRQLQAEAWTRCADHPALKATGLSGTLHHHNPYR